MVLVSGADPLIGRVIAGKMELSELLGAGAMGKVYRARHRGLDKTVAIKVLHAEASAAPTLAARFQAEARAASRLDHPNSLRVLDFGEDGPDALLYIAMELLEGETLQSVLARERKLAPSRAAWIMGQVCSALAAAHDQGVIHRDVKPANVILTTQRGDQGLVGDFVKVCDFGLAKVLDTHSETSSSGPLTQQGVVLGTPAYMSPEQAKGEPVDHRADIYACGVMLYRMLSGRKPFIGDSAWAVSLKQIAEAPPPLRDLAPEISDALAAVVHRALQKAPGARYQSARALRAALLDAAGVPNDSGGASARFAEPTVDLDPTFIRASDQSVPVSEALGGAGRRRTLAIAGAVLTAAAIALFVILPRAPAVEATPIAIEAPAAPPPAAPAEVEVAIDGAPAGTRVFANDVLLGALPGVLTLDRGGRPIGLRFEANGYESLARSVIPDRDLHLTIALRPLAPPPSSPPAKARSHSAPPSNPRKKDRHALENPFE